MAYKEFQNGFPLPASDLNNYLMDQSVIVFVNATERAAAIPDPHEGMLTYIENVASYQYWTGADWENLVSGGTPIEADLLTTTGDVIYASAAETPARLGIGSEGEVLTVTSGIPSWEALPTAGALTWDFIGTTTPSTGVSAFTITGLTGYAKYVIKFTGLKSSSACYWNMWVNGTDFTSSRLKTVGNGSASNMRTSNELARTSGSTIGMEGQIYLEFNSSDGGAFYAFQTGSVGTTSTDENYGGNMYLPRPSTSLEIRLSAGTLTAGSYSLYGAN